MDTTAFSEIVRARIPASMHEALERAAADRHQTVAVIVRDALREYLQRYGALPVAGAEDSVPGAPVEGEDAR